MASNSPQKFSSELGLGPKTSEISPFYSKAYDYFELQANQKKQVELALSVRGLRLRREQEEQNLLQKLEKEAKVKNLISRFQTPTSSPVKSASSAHSPERSALKTRSLTREPTQAPPESSRKRTTMLQSFANKALSLSPVSSAKTTSGTDSERGSSTPVGLSSPTTQHSTQSSDTQSSILSQPSVEGQVLENSKESKPKRSSKQTSKTGFLSSVRKEMSSKKSRRRDRDFFSLQVGPRVDPMHTRFSVVDDDPEETVFNEFTESFEKRGSVLSVAVAYVKDENYGEEIGYAQTQRDPGSLGHIADNRARSVSYRHLPRNLSGLNNATHSPPLPKKRGGIPQYFLNSDKRVTQMSQDLMEVEKRRVEKQKEEKEKEQRLKQIEEQIEREKEQREKEIKLEEERKRQEQEQREKEQREREEREQREREEREQREKQEREQREKEEKEQREKEEQEKRKQEQEQREKQEQQQEQERLEQEKLKQKQEEERLEQEKLKQKQEEERLEQERKRLEEKKERERIQREKEQREEEERKKREQLEKEQLEKKLTEEREKLLQEKKKIEIERQQIKEEELRLQREQELLEQEILNYQNEQHDSERDDDSLDSPQQVSRGESMTNSPQQEVKEPMTKSTHQKGQESISELQRKVKEKLIEKKQTRDRSDSRDRSDDELQESTEKLKTKVKNLKSHSSIPTDSKDTQLKSEEIWNRIQNMKEKSTQRRSRASEGLLSSQQEIREKFKNAKKMRQPHEKPTRRKSHMSDRQSIDLRLNLLEEKLREYTHKETGSSSSPYRLSSSSRNSIDALDLEGNSPQGEIYPAQSTSPPSKFSENTRDLQQYSQDSMPRRMAPIPQDPLYGGDSIPRRMAPNPEDDSSSSPANRRGRAALPTDWLQGKGSTRTEEEETEDSLSSTSDTEAMPQRTVPDPQNLRSSIPQGMAPDPELIPTFAEDEEIEGFMPTGKAPDPEHQEDKPESGELYRRSSIPQGMAPDPQNFRNSIPRGMAPDPQNFRNSIPRGMAPDPELIPSFTEDEETKDSLSSTSDTETMPQRTVPDPQNLRSSIPQGMAPDPQNFRNSIPRGMAPDPDNLKNLHDSIPQGMAPEPEGNTVNIWKTMPEISSSKPKTPPPFFEAEDHFDALPSLSLKPTNSFLEIPERSAPLTPSRTASVKNLDVFLPNNAIIDLSVENDKKLKKKRPDRKSVSSPNLQHLSNIAIQKTIDEIGDLYLQSATEELKEWASIPTLRRDWQKFNNLARKEADSVITQLSAIWNIELGSSDDKIPEDIWIDADIEFPFYSEFILPQEHQNFFGISPKLGPIAISVEYNKNRKDTKIVKVLIRTQKGDTRVGLVKRYEQDFPEPALTVKKLQSQIDILKNIEFLVCPKDSEIKIQLMLKSFETKFINKNQKIGVVWATGNQSQETEFLTNQQHSPAFERFMECIATKVPLKGFQAFSGGLDTRADTTGTHSYFTVLGQYQQMFHVATLLPFNPRDKQQLEKKRHIGNDIVVVIFWESSQKFDPNKFTGQFNHVYIVVEPVTEEDEIGTEYYKLSIVTKAGFPPFSPHFPMNFLFKRGAAFREFFLAKCLNGEHAAKECLNFSDLRERTRRQLLQEMVDLMPKKGFLKKMKKMF